MPNRYLIKGSNPTTGGFVPLGGWDTRDKAIDVAWEWKKLNPLDCVIVFDKLENKTVWSSLDYK